MTRRFENIVRPFETPRIGPPQRIFSPYQEASETTLLQLGRGGSGKVMNGSYSFTQTHYMDTRLKESAA